MAQELSNALVQLMPLFFRGLRFHLNSLKPDELHRMQARVQQRLTEGAWFNAQGINIISEQFLALFMRQKELNLLISEAEHFFGHNRINEVLDGLSPSDLEEIIEVISEQLAKSLYKSRGIELFIRSLKNDERLLNLKVKLDRYTQELVVKIKKKPKLVTDSFLKSQSETVRYAALTLIRSLIDGTLISELVLNSLDAALAQLLLQEKHFLLTKKEVSLATLDNFSIDAAIHSISQLIAFVAPQILKTFVDVVFKESLIKEYLSIIRNGKLSHFEILPFLVNSFGGKYFISLFSENLNNKNSYIFLSSLIKGFSRSELEDNVILLISLILSHGTNLEQRISFKTHLASLAFMIQLTENAKKSIENILDGGNEFKLSLKAKLLLLVSKGLGVNRTLKCALDDLEKKVIEDISYFYAYPLTQVYTVYKNVTHEILFVFQEGILPSDKKIEGIERHLIELSVLLGHSEIKKSLLNHQAFCHDPRVHYLNPKEREIKKNKVEFFNSVLEIEKIISKTNFKTRKAILINNIQIYKSLVEEKQRVEESLNNLDYSLTHVRSLFKEWWGIFLMVLPLVVINFYLKDEIKKRTSKIKDDKEKMTLILKKIEKKKEFMERKPYEMIDVRFWKSKKANNKHKELKQCSLPSSRTQIVAMS